MLPPHSRHSALWIEQLFNDVRYATRGLWKSRTFTLTTVLTLAVGLGLLTVVFTIFDAYVLRPFAVRDPYSLNVVGWESKDAQGWRFSWREFQEVRQRRELFEDVSAERTQFVLSGERQLYTPVSCPGITSTCLARGYRSAGRWQNSMSHPLGTAGGGSERRRMDPVVQPRSGCTRRDDSRSINNRS